MVERTGLENRNTGNRIGGSNPPASALYLRKSHSHRFLTGLRKTGI